MKNISKTTLAAAVIAGATIVGSASALAFDGAGQGLKDGHMGGNREDKVHLMPPEMRDQFREEYNNATDEEKMEFREMRRSHMNERRKKVAEFTGLSRDEMREAHQNGDSLGDILVKSGKTREDAEDFLTQAANNHIGEMAEYHSLSDAQVETIQSQISGFVNSILGRWFQ